MERAKVIVFEDNDGIRSLLELLLKQHGHVIVAEAANREQAQRAISAVRSGELDADVAIIDGDLDFPGEGAKIAATLEETDPTIVRIGFSGNDEGVEGVDINFQKPGDRSSLTGFIDELPNRPAATVS